MVIEQSYPAGTLVKVWIGAFTGSPGTPPPNAQGITCRIAHWNSVHQAYIVPVDPMNSPPTPSGNVGMYVFASAILGGRCECEKPGHFFSGVPGVIGRVIDGKIDSEIERCDACERFPSDAAAEAALRQILNSPSGSAGSKT